MRRKAGRHNRWAWPAPRQGQACFRHAQAYPQLFSAGDQLCLISTQSDGGPSVLGQISSELVAIGGNKAQGRDQAAAGTSASDGALGQWPQDTLSDSFTYFS